MRSIRRTPLCFLIGGTFFASVGGDICCNRHAAPIIATSFGPPVGVVALPHDQAPCVDLPDGRRCVPRVSFSAVVALCAPGPQPAGKKARLTNVPAAVPVEMPAEKLLKRDPDSKEAAPGGGEDASCSFVDLDDLPIAALTPTFLREPVPTTLDREFVDPDGKPLPKRRRPPDRE
mmetsp:Transcript_119948/g.274839  ORF Transcript_119948/g.274839 Transcript_119948/m.274839 type:complete len:175 (-) Transcript_119948:181-705(-)